MIGRFLLASILVVGTIRAGGPSGGRGFQGYDQYPITGQEVEVHSHDQGDEYFTRFASPARPRPSPKVDLAQLGIVAVIKFLLLKVKLLAIGLFFLIKLPIVFMSGAFKFLLALKALKLIKLFSIPLLVPLIVSSLLPLAALFLPLILPFLLLLPVPILTTTTTMAPNAGGRRKREEPQDATDDLMSLRNLLESGECMERIACRLAARNALPFKPFVPWALQLMEKVIPHYKLPYYTRAYQQSADQGMTLDDCSAKYTCYGDVTNIS